jgi:hypothetical protein
VGESSYWNSTAIIVTWDDFGGYFDHEPPPLFDDMGGLGFRVPMLIAAAPVLVDTVGAQKGFLLASIARRRSEGRRRLAFIEG